MDNKLTTTQQETFDFRIACAYVRVDSTTAPRSPQRVGASDLQGTRFGSAEVESAWPTTVVASRTGGAPSSKWTRKTRPWNASLPTTVVSSSNAFEKIDESDPSDAEFMANHPPYSLPEWRPHGVRGEGALMRLVARSFSGPHCRRRTQRVSREVSAVKLPERAAASTAPSSSVR
jgi:hypothetical protein